MCGIFGISYGEGGPASEDWTPNEFMQIMFPAIVHRGPHAYGWMWYDGSDIWYQKFEGRADTPEALDTMAIDNESEVKWMVCHVRYATHGSPENLLNNHPLQHGNIIGVHNGVIRNYQEILDVTGRDNPETEVDSESIFAAIDHYGHRAGLRKINGDMVAVYANTQKPNTLHIARTHGRPLEMCRSNNGSTFFASEGGVIDATGITHSPFSGVSMNRLLRVRGGKITERITFRQYDRVASNINPPVIGRTHESWFAQALQQDRATKRGQMWAERQAREKGKITNPSVMHAEQIARQQARIDARAEAAQKLKEAADDPRFHNLAEHESLEGLFKYKGRIMTEDQYLEEMVNSLADDEPADAEEGA